MRFPFGKPQPVLVRLQITVPWQAAYDPESGTWIAVCAPLNLNALGDTWSELLQGAEDAMQLLFRDLFASGELEPFLRLNGWASAIPLPARGAPVPRFDIPFVVQRKTRFEELVPVTA